ncbi:hypothetical protein ZOSMA_50G00840 [Zostera marina]|uniref:Uncharacterized protein n=1 Tax=Zostera marina TaxID=29655 RepID=A0A0K9P0C0_ZOSMR|nr:hypothetical protein ZOSMA_50G00840 [Zostera marina]
MDLHSVQPLPSGAHRILNQAIKDV